MEPAEHDLDFLATVAAHPDYRPTPEQRQALSAAATAFPQASHVVLWTGGKAGRGASAY